MRKTEKGSNCVPQSKRIIDIEAAVDMLCEFIREADTDTIARIFSEEFGYTVKVDTDRGVLICTPDKMCGNRLNEGDFLTGESVIVPDPNESDIHNHSFEGVVTDVENGIATVVDGEGERFNIEVERLEMEG